MLPQGKWPISALKILLLIFGFGLILTTGSASGTPIKPIALQRLAGYISLGMDNNENSRENLLSGGKIGQRKTIFSEEVNVRLAGYAYHPRLLEFRAESEFEFEQRLVNRLGGASKNSNGLFSNYSVSSNFLKEHFVSLQIEADQHTSDVEQDFFGRRKIIYAQEAATLSYRNKNVPTVLTYTTSRANGKYNDPTDDNQETVNLQMRHLGKMGMNRMVLEHREKDQAAQQRHLRINAAEFVNSKQFGKDRRHALTSQFRYLDQTGTDQYRNLSAGQNLLSRLTDTLQGRYSVQFLETVFPNQGTSTLYGSTSLQHQLYESLTSTVELLGRRSRFGDGKENRFGGQTNFRYSKMLPFGRMNLSYQALAENIEEDFTDESVFIRQEQHFFGENPAGDEVIVLERDFADQTSIEISAVDGLAVIDPETGFPISEGMHYTVESDGIVTRIRLLLPGLFLRGEGGTAPAVFVSYDLLPVPPLGYAIFSQTFSTSLSLGKTWKFFYSASQTDQNLKKGINQGQLEDSGRNAFGLELNWRNTVGRFKKERVSSKKTPLKRITISETLLIPLPTNPFWRSTLHVGASYSESATFADVEKTYSRTLTAAVSISRNQFHANMEAQYSNDDFLGEDVDSFGFLANMGWSLRQVSLLFNYEYRLRKRELSGDEMSSALMFEVRRKFSVF